MYSLTIFITRLKQGDLVILKPFDIHYMESRDIDFYERYVLNFSGDMLSGILTKQKPPFFSITSSRAYSILMMSNLLLFSITSKIDIFQTE